MFRRCCDSRVFALAARRGRCAASAANSGNRRSPAPGGADGFRQVLSCGSRRFPAVAMGPTQQTRSYRGEAKDGTANLSEEEQVLLERAVPRSEEILKKHVAFPDLAKIPSSSLDPETREKLLLKNENSELIAGTNEELNLEIRRKRLVYRSKQRGWLEVDLLLGTWASEYVPQLDAQELDQYERFVNQETIDIYNVITLRIDVPEELKSADRGRPSVVERIQEWARNSPLGKADPDKYREAKAKANLI